MYTSAILRKPRTLRRGDTLAVLSPSKGLPALFPQVYEAGLATLRELGFQIREYPSARMAFDEVYAHPELRAADINAAFADPDIAGIVSSIGGDDSARILRHLDLPLIARNPKFFIGYSDFTSVSVALHLQGLVTFNGPSVMAGFAQYRHFPPAYQAYLRDTLLAPSPRHVLPQFPDYANGYGDWSDPQHCCDLAGWRSDAGPRFLQGSGTHHGRLFGGCMEVLEMLKGTAWWPQADFWQGRILFLETSQEKPSLDYVKYWLRNYGVMGVFGQLAGLIVGRARDYSGEEKAQLDQVIVQVVRGEFGCSNLPIVSNAGFGHTDPQLVLPLGIEFAIDCEQRQLIQCESAFIL